MKRAITILIICAASVAVGYFLGYGIGKILKTMQKDIEYPETAREGVVDNYHGVEIADPYRWLEDDMSERTAEWVKAQNEANNFPDIGEMIVSIETNPFVPQVRYVDEKNNVVCYFITVRLRYVNRTPRKTVEYEFTD